MLLIRLVQNFESSEVKITVRCTYSYLIGEIMTPRQDVGGLQPMLTESSVTPIDQKTLSVLTGTQG